MITQRQPPPDFDAVFLSRLFYFTMHIIIITTLVLYKNSYQQINISNTLFMILVLYSNYLFLTIAKNPGYISKPDQDDAIVFISDNDGDYCQVCEINKPIRSKHCRTCKKCVAKFDHHCFWIGGCVGELNHRLFWLFLLIQSLVLLKLLDYFTDGMSNYEYSYYKDEILVYSQEFGAFLVLFVVMGCFLLFSGGMWLFHTYLIVVGSTTYELTKSHKLKYLKNGNPFDQGIFKNIYRGCCHGNQLIDWK